MGNIINKILVDSNTYEISSLDTPRIQFIRDWVYGNNQDSSSSWVSCQVWKDGVNLATAATVKYYSATSELSASFDKTLYNDGKLIQYDNSSSLDEGAVISSSYITITADEERCLELNLGKVYHGIEYIKVWHDYSDQKIYNHRLEISEDGILWLELFNSVNGGYVETAEGKTYAFSDRHASIELAKTNQHIDSVESQVLENEDSISSIQLSIEEINARVDENKEIYDNFISEDFASLLEKIETKEYAEEVVERSKIKEEIIKEVEEKNYTTKSEMIENNSFWEATFNKIGVDYVSTEEEKAAIKTLMQNNQIAMSMDNNGITISSLDTEGISIKNEFNTQGIKNSYNNQPIFWTEKDSVMTEQVYCKKGLHTDCVKIIPVNYNVNGTDYGMLAFVKASNLN